MKTSLCSITLLIAALSFSACSKDDQVAPQPVADLSGTWQLTSRFSLDSDSATWQPVAAGDSSYYLFRKNGTYVFYTNHYQNEGSFHLSVVDNKLRLVTTEEPNGLLIEQLNENEIRVDAWLISCVTGYTSRKFVKVSQ